MQHLRPGRPVVAVFGPGLGVPYGFQQVNRLVSAYPELGAVFAVAEVTADVLQASLRAGARDTVSLADSAALTAVGVPGRGTPLQRVPHACPAVAEVRGTPGKLIAVFSTKGGVGKSTIAINMAVSMARRTDERVALVDGDLQFGDVAVLLGLPPQHTVLDAAAAVQVGDSQLLRAILSRHESGLFVLPAPTEPVLGSQMAPGEIAGLCNELRNLFGYVIVDMPAQFDEYVLAVVDLADDVLLVGSMDIPSVKNLKIGIQALDLAAIAGPKMRLVLNRANTQVKLDVREIEQVLGMRAEFPIPSDIAVPMSVNAGIPVVDHDAAGAASRALSPPGVVVPGRRSRDAARSVARSARRASEEADGMTVQQQAPRGWADGQRQQATTARRPRARGPAPEDAPVRHPGAGPDPLRPAGLGSRHPQAGRGAAAPRAGPGAPRAPGQRAPGARAVGVRRRARIRADRQAPARPGRQRSHGQRPRQGVHRARGQDRPDRDQVRRREPPPADHRQDREPGRSPRRRSDAHGRRPPPGRIPRQRDRAPARDRWSVHDDPALRRRSVPGRRPRRTWGR